ncbi:MAG: envelope stress response membrane protein PspB [Hyphomonadaceae bacterium]|nr:envelope stress response membrane protein PspB [Hyphomonadaceae bacterium]MBC6413059.1 envelope stress response membrane protein PspB [Hyphomonadaceae bacterium]
MDVAHLALMIPIVAILMVSGSGMLKMYLAHKERMMDHLSGDQIAELEQMSKIADILDQRVNVLESILDDEIPNWRERYDKTVSPQ